MTTHGDMRRYIRCGLREWCSAGCPHPAGSSVERGLLMKGRIFEIQRFSIHDGPGIRTTVFLKGCPLKCRWCHNPEGISPKPHLSFLPGKCIGCGYCLKACRRHAHRVVDGKHVLDRSLCQVCGECTKECYAGALELVGRDVTVGEVLDEVMRDKPFYLTSGGGMTLSGGEPLMQMDFTEALLKGARDERLHCCVETSGFAEFSQFERILSLVDLFLYDIKDIDDERHMQYTGVHNDVILRNVKKLHDHGAKVRLRLPIVPGWNDRDDHFRGVADLAKSMPNLDGIEIMPYHLLGTSKLDRMGFRRSEWIESRMPERETVERWISRFAELGVNVAVS